MGCGAARGGIDLGVGVALRGRNREVARKGALQAANTHANRTHTHACTRIKYRLLLCSDTESAQTNKRQKGGFLCAPVFDGARPRWHGKTTPPGCV